MSNPLTQDATGLTVAPAPLEDWHLMAEWAAAEGWNPGDGDIACFHPTDPAGFFIGRIDGEPVSAVSVVNYDERYAFLGFYLVVPEARGRGLGLATWRAAFLARWLTAPGHTAYARLREGRVTGYGVIRPSRDGNRIGPLFADSRDDAEALFDSLTAHLGPEDVVAVDMPEPLAPAAALAADRGLEAQFPTVRMYTGPAPEVRTDRIFGATSLELG